MIEAATPAALARAVALLEAGELVAFPTETVYGLGADAANPQAVARIFAAKGRPSDHPVIVHLADQAGLAHWAAAVPAAASALAERFWPGPLTLILRRARGVPDAVTGGQDTVGVRCPAHPVAQALLQAFAQAGGSGALAAPSANRFGRISPTTAQHVQSEFGQRVPLILDGGSCDVGIESTIVDLSRERPVLLRPGHIGAAALQACLGEPVWLPDGSPALADGVPDAHDRPSQEGAAPRASGTLAAHYAPVTPMALVASQDLPARIDAVLAAGGSAAVWSRTAVPAQSGVLWRQAPAEAAAYARQLYAVLREFDAAGVTQLLIEAPPMDAAWAAVHDRLGRAVTGSGVRS